MIKLDIKHTKIKASCLETLVVGNVNSIFIECAFSPEWNELSKIAVFSNGASKVSVLLSEDICAIPWEMLSCPGELLVAVRGVGDGGALVLCTENASLGNVNESLADDDTELPDDATPAVFDTLVADIAELKHFRDSAEEFNTQALSGYATEQWVEAKGYLTAHQSLAGYYSKSELDTIADGLSGDISALENSKQSKLRAGTGISITADGTISVSMPAWQGGNY